MSKDFKEKNPAPSSSDDLYSDYPEDIVKIMMENHPFKKDEKSMEDESTNNDIEKMTKSEDGDIYSPNKRGMSEKRKEGADLDDDLSSFKFDTDTLFNELDKKGKKKPDDIHTDKYDTETLNTDAKKTRNDVPVIDNMDAYDDMPDDITEIPRKRTENKKTDEADEEQIQVVRHKERPKNYKRDFSTEELNDFEEIKKRIAEEKRERREYMENGGNKRKHSPHKRDTYNEMQYKKKRNKSNDTLDLLKTPNENSKLRQHSEITAEGKKLIIAAGVAVFLFLFLFVRNITLTHKVNVLNSQLTDYQDMKQKNEEYKLEILSLQDKLKTNATPSEGGESISKNSSQQGNAGSTGKMDTYTVAEGDTLSGISQKVYGNYSGYKKILDANGLTENSNIKIGQTLKIPR